MEKEKIGWVAHLRLEKRRGDINLCSTPEERLRWLQENEPYEVKEVTGNLLLNEGMDTCLSLLTGYGSETVYNNASARVGVGNLCAVHPDQLSR